MIVVAIVAILAAIAMPAYQSYVTRAKFSEVVATSGPAKTAYEVCVQGTDMTGAAIIADTSSANTSCAAAASAAGATSFTAVTGTSTYGVKALGVAKTASGATITVSGSDAFNATSTATFTLDGVIDSTTKKVTWTKGGTCVGQGFC